MCQELQLTFPTGYREGLDRWVQTMAEWLLERKPAIVAPADADMVWNGACKLLNGSGT